MQHSWETHSGLDISLPKVYKLGREGERTCLVCRLNRSDSQSSFRYIKKRSLQSDCATVGQPTLGHSELSTSLNITKRKFNVNPTLTEHTFYLADSKTTESGRQNLELLFQCTAFVAVFFSVAIVFFFFPRLLDSAYY